MRDGYSPPRSVEPPDLPKMRLYSHTQKGGMMSPVKPPTWFAFCPNAGENLCQDSTGVNHRSQRTRTHFRTREECEDAVREVARPNEVWEICVTQCVTRYIRYE